MATSEYTTLYFNGWRIEIFYCEEENNYCIPIFQAELLLEESVIIKEKLLALIFSITESIGKNDYLYDTSEGYIQKEKGNIVHLSDLKENFKQITSLELTDFIRNTKKEYLEDALDWNLKIKQYIIYVLHICYIYYSNSIKLKDISDELVESVRKDSIILYELEKRFNRERAEYIQKVSMEQFKKYIEILNTFFNLMNHT